MGRGWGWCPGLLWELQCRCLYGLWQLSSAAVPYSQPHPHPSISILRASPCSVHQQLHFPAQTQQIGSVSQQREAHERKDRK